MSEGILSGPIDAAPVGPVVYPPVTVRPGLVVRHRSGVTGAVVDWRPSRVTLLDRAGRRHQLLNEGGAFLVDGRAVTLVAPERHPRRRTTASGSVAADTTARVARGSRIWVEGIHDAELVELVWGDDLRVEGIVVEPMSGIDDLAAAVTRFAPHAGRRLGVLVDHLVAGSKEHRIAAGVRHPHVAITGHPFVDVWAAVSPRLVGLEAWPDIPRGEPWKEGVCRRLGVEEPAVFWRRLIGRVASYRDLHPSLVGAVEQLIDFVTSPDAS